MLFCAKPRKLKADERAELERADDLARVGPTKPMGYLPKATLKKYCARWETEILPELVARGVCVFSLTEDESHVASGAVIAFDREALTKHIAKHRVTIAAAKWPISVMEYVMKVLTTLVGKNVNPKMYRVIGLGYADARFTKPKKRRRSNLVKSRPSSGAC